jgi:hypothetical protein
VRYEQIGRGILAYFPPQRDIQIGKFDGGGLRHILMAATFGMSFAKVLSPTTDKFSMGLVYKF